MTRWLQRLRGRPTAVTRFWREAPAPAEADWQKIGGLPVRHSGRPDQVSIATNRAFRRIKLRSLGADIDIDHWVLEFSDGTILDLSVNCLVEGSESRPMPIAGRQLKRVIVNFDARRVTRRARLEIWAQA